MSPEENYQRTVAELTEKHFAEKLAELQSRRTLSDILINGTDLQPYSGASNAGGSGTVMIANYSALEERILAHYREGDTAMAITPLDYNSPAAAKQRRYEAKLDSIRLQYAMMPLFYDACIAPIWSPPAVDLWNSAAMFNVPAPGYASSYGSSGTYAWVEGAWREVGGLSIKFNQPYTLRASRSEPNAPLRVSVETGNRRKRRAP